MLNNFFVNESLPSPLTEEEVFENFIKLSKGDMEARKKLITHNIKIVIGVVNKVFATTPYDKEELVSVGLIGLIKSVDAFDINRRVPFYFYAKTCIVKEILAYMKSNKKHLNNISIEHPLNEKYGGEKLTIKDTLFADIDLESEYIEKAITLLIKDYITKLEGRDKIIFLYRYGLIDGKFHTYKEIANKLNISGHYVGVLEHKILNRIKEFLECKEKHKKIVS